MNAPRATNDDDNDAFARLLEENSRLSRELQYYKSLTTSAERAHALSETIDVLARAMDEDSALRNIYSVALRGLQRVLGIERASILFWDPDGVMRFKAWVGISDAYRQAVEGHSPWAREALDPQPIVVSDVLQDATLTPYAPIFARENIRALAFIPLVHRGKLLGKFMLYAREPSHFEREMEFTMALGKLIAFGIFRMKAEENLRASEELFRATFDYSSLGKTLVSVRDGRFERVNEKFSQMTGYSVDELTKLTFADISYPDDVQESHNAFQRIREGLHAYHRDKRYLRKDGSILWASINASPIRNGSGQVVSIFTAIQDITARKEMEAKLFESITQQEKVQQELRRAKEELEIRVQERTSDLSQTNAFLSSLIENLPNMIFVKDAKNLRFVRFNKAGEELVGYSSAELIGKNDFDFFPESEASFFTTMDRTVLENRRVVDIAEELIQTRTKGVRILHTKKIPLFDLEGRAEYLVGISEDITDQKRADEDRIKLVQEREARLEAEKAIQLRDDFLSIAAHELRTPLTPIRMYLQLTKQHVETLAADLPKVDLIKTAIRRTDQEFERFLRLVENLLDVSRMSAGRLILDRREFDLGELVKNVLDRFGAELRKAQCESSFHVEGPVLGRWDQTRLEQVVVNLLTNAMKYGAEKPIDVKVSRADGKALIAITDHGIGISKEDQERIFHRFERVAPLKHFGGFGLGLFISQEIVVAHGGTIRLTSEPGVGSTFTVELPI